MYSWCWKKAETKSVLLNMNKLLLLVLFWWSFAGDENTSVEITVVTLVFQKGMFRTVD